MERLSLGGGRSVVPPIASHLDQCTQFGVPPAQLESVQGEGNDMGEETSKCVMFRTFKGPGAG